MLVVITLILFAILLAAMSLISWVSSNTGNEIAEVEAGYLPMVMTGLKSSSVHFLVILVVFLIFDLELVLALVVVVGGHLVVMFVILFFMVASMWAEWIGGKLTWIA